MAHWVAGWEGATIAVPAPSTLVLPVIAIGGLWLMLFSRDGAMGVVGDSVVLDW